MRWGELRWMGALPTHPARPTSTEARPVSEASRADPKDAAMLTVDAAALASCLAPADIRGCFLAGCCPPAGSGGGILWGCCPPAAFPRLDMGSERRALQERGTSNSPTEPDRLHDQVPYIWLPHFFPPRLHMERGARTSNDSKYEHDMMSTYTATRIIMISWGTRTPNKNITMRPQPECTPNTP